MIQQKHIPDQTDYDTQNNFVSECNIEEDIQDEGLNSKYNSNYKRNSIKVSNTKKIDEIQYESDLEAQKTSRTLNIERLKDHHKSYKRTNIKNQNKCCNLDKLKFQLKKEKMSQSMQECEHDFTYFVVEKKLNEQIKPQFRVTQFLNESMNFHFSLRYHISKDVPKEKHKPILGYAHNYYPEIFDNNQLPAYKCSICDEGLIKHQEHLEFFKTNMKVKPVRKRMHSFSEHEKCDLLNANKKDLDQKLRYRKVNKDIYQSNEKTFYCDICYLECNISSIVFLECGHYYCKECLQDFFQVAVNLTGQVQKLKCPNSDCGYRIDANQIQNLLSKDSFEKFQRLMLNYDVAKQPNKKFCPFPGCENVVCGKKGLTKTQCNKCHRNFCYTCQTPWHLGKSCEKAQKSMYAGWASNMMKAHRCPKCQTPIEKNEGCNHMICYMCGHEYCWQCGLPMNHFIHKDQYSNPLSCQHVPSTKAGWTGRSVLFILGFLLIPILLLMAPLVYGSVIGGGLGYECIRSVKKVKNWCCKLFLCLSGIPLLFLLITLGAILGGALGMIMLPILLIPAYAYHLYVFCRILHWWNLQRIKG